MATNAFESFVRKYKLWLIHIGHSWFICRVEEEGLTNKTLRAIEATLPRTVIYREVRQVTDAEDLKKFAEIADVSEKTIQGLLNAVIPASGYRTILSLKGWGC